MKTHLRISVYVTHLRRTRNLCSNNVCNLGICRPTLIYSRTIQAPIQICIGRTDIQGHLHQLYASMDEYNFRLKDLQSHSSRLGQDFRVEARRRSSRPGTPQPEEALGPLREELHNRLQKGAEVDMSLTETKKALQTAELRLQVQFNT